VSSSMRNMILRSVALVALSLVALVPISEAGSITYKFTGTNNAVGGDGLTVAFQYTSSGFINPTPPYLSLIASQLDSCTNCVVSTFIPAVAFQLPSLTFGDQIDFADILGEGSAYAFPYGAFLAVGTYHSTSPYNSGTLVVSATPEPSSIFLFASGLLLLAIISKRFRRSANIPVKYFS
jgi:hypothetical protein